jgi:hypothetical protein
MRVRTKRLLGVLAMFSILLPVLAACDTGQDKGEVSRENAVDDRWSSFDKAEARYPAPRPQNFPIRGALVKFTERQDQINHPWYIYILGMNGEKIGYFVGQTYPVNACDFLSSTEDIRTHGNTGMVVTTAPSYDGVYYGNSECNTYFFFDVETDAMLTFTAPMWIATDAPLEIDVQQIDSSTVPPASTPEVP